MKTKTVGRHFVRQEMHSGVVFEKVFFRPAILSFHFIKKISENFQWLGAYDFVLIVDDKQRDAR